MIAWTPQQVAEAAGAELLAADPSALPAGGPTHAVIGSADVTPGALFAGLPGANVDGGRFSADALTRGAWGALARPEHLEALVASGGVPAGAVLLATTDPLLALQRLATAWRRALGATVIGVTGSTGKTTTKELVAAMGRTVAPTHATAANFNTEIGLPLTILGAPADTKLLVLEMGMRGAGQIAELCEIAEPDVGIVVNVGPAHLELMGSIEAIAREKGSLLDHLPPGGTAIAPADEPLLAGHRREGVHWVTFGPAGDVPVEAVPPALGLAARPAHVQLDAAAALAAVRAAGIEPVGPLEALPGAGRGAVHEGVAGSTVIDDCYNANPMSMRAALTELSQREATRRVAVLGDMLELGDQSALLHADLGDQATEAGVGLLVTVGPRAAAAATTFSGGEVLGFDTASQAAEALPSLVEDGDAVLVKGSRGVGLEVVVAALTNEREMA
ncbi:MAG: UDP-N-acetylmuramoyl-tripeptide--D-alanyl-D-alanine ligase [Solirubrobacteraceae bacterium]|nr:UDP-N-acetylmuramoyl-tripeptide--D-alanyl-D-alanine ligase [Solirubrobacteraceae bacterium]